MKKGALLVACYLVLLLTSAFLISRLLGALPNLFSAIVFFVGLLLPIGVLMLLAGALLYVWPERSKP